MSISAIFGNGTSALLANQEALRVASTNISNVNTPGYVRQEAQFQTRVLGGGSAGVDISVVRRAADQFLQNTTFRANGLAQSSTVSAEILGRAQASFGNPTTPNSLFARLDTLFTAFSDLSIDPTSQPRRAVAVNNLSETLSNVRQVSNSLDGLVREADSRIVSSVNQANDLLQRIAGLNGDITRYVNTGADASGVLSEQARAIDELSGLIDIRAIPRTQGGVEIRTQDGALLVSQTAGQLSYRGGTSNANAEFSQILLQSPGVTGAGSPVQNSIQTGQIRGLIDVRDQRLPSLRAGIAELSAGLADALNAAHNQGAALPPPNQLTGRNTGLVGTDSLGFSGRTTFAIVNASGQLVSQTEVDLSGIGTLNGAVAAINGALGANGTASFANGRLSIQASNNANGIVVSDVNAPTSSRGGRGFSQFFGLNDVVDSAAPLFYETGLAATDSLGVTSGSIRLEVRGSGGGALSSTILAPAGQSVQGFVNSLNADPALSGAFVFSLDTNGRLNATPRPGSQALRIAVIEDTTTRGDTGLSVTSLFGLSRAARNDRASGLEIRPAIANNRNLLATAAPQLAGAVPGDRVINEGDGRAAGNLAAVFEQVRTFQAEGLTAAQSTIADFSARLAGEAGSLAATAERSRSAAVALSDETGARRAAVEGVNLDEELVRLTQYQQSYTAAARLIQTADELLQILLTIGQ